MSDYSQLNALRQVAVACKKEMEATKVLSERRAIIDKHLRPLSIKFGMKKIDLQAEIHALTKGC